MWEISLNLKAENIDIANLLYNSLSLPIQEMRGVITSNEEHGYISILVGVEKDNKEKAKLVMDAFHYQLEKEIGAMAVVLGGKVDQIILTGGIAYNAVTQEHMKNAVDWIAPVTVYPGEDELLALAQGAIRVMSGEEKAMKY